MATRNRTPRQPGAGWPKRALGLFILITIVIYSLVFLTGNHKATPKLGIDLQGGTRVTLVPQGQQPTPEQLSQARKILENRVNGMGVSGATVQTDGNTLVITVPGSDSQQARTLGQTSQLLFRPVDSQGLAGTAPKQVADEAQKMANEWVKARVITTAQADASLKRLQGALKQVNEQAPEDQKFEVPEFKVDAKPAPEPANSIEAQKDREATSKLVLDDRQSDNPNVLQAAFFLLQCDEAIDPIAGQDDPAKPLVTCNENNQPMVLGPAPLLVGEDDPVKGKRLTGEEIDTGAPIQGGYDPQQGAMVINFKFRTSANDKGGDTWAKLTQDYLKRQVAITLDSRVISAPVIQSPTPAGSGTQITGQFTEDEAKDLANNLKYGALPLSFAGENGERGGTAITIPATLGFASLEAGLVAGIVALILVALYSLLYYRGLGAIIVTSLAVAGALIYGTLVLLGRWVGYSLDLAGIAGLIIGIGTTADSFVVYFERIKDEVRDGKTFRSSVPRAWARAKHTILSGNLVSLIAAIVLYILAVGDVKGFAFTLGLTTVFDLLVVFLVSAPLVVLASRSKIFANPKFNGLGAVMRVAERRRKRGDFDELPQDGQPITTRLGREASGTDAAADTHAAEEK